MPKYRAPSPSGKRRKSKSATVARVRISMFIHMGRMNSITVIFERLNEDLVSIHAAGYAMSRHSSVLTNATCMEYRKVFRSCGALKNLAKFARVKAPVWASPERIHYYHHERERDEQHQEYQIWKSPGGSRYLHFPAESLMFPGAKLIPTRSPLSHTSSVSTQT